MKKIAVIEDNPDNRLLVRALLEDSYELTEYDNGNDALDVMRQSPPDLILLDISLPGIDGVEVLRLIREDPRLATLPVIALTAHAMDTARERFLEAGFDQYVSKPITDEDVLLDSIRDLLRKSASD
jgi:CheY-like chemotaxis protein